MPSGISATDSLPPDSGVAVGSPLRGEWAALHTPADRVPSHGANFLGQRYAYDFVRLATRSDLPYEYGFVKHLLAFQPAHAFLCWDEPVYAVFDGVVTETGEGWPDRRKVNLLYALFSSTVLPPSPSEDDLRPLVGNYVIVEGEAAVAFYAHLRKGSLAVEAGREVKTGEVLGRVGNSGNSTMPHLHFHLMDRPDIRAAEGVVCRFRAFEQFEQEGWKDTSDGIPGSLKRIRWG